MRAYLHPVHAGLHLQLLHSLPGLGDAGSAVIGHAFFHSAAPETTKVKGLKELLFQSKAEPPSAFSPPTHCSFPFRARESWEPTLLG